MKTSAETKFGPSVVAETLKSLAEQAKLCHEKIDQLEAAQSVNRAEIIGEVSKLIDLCQNLRDAVLSEDNTASWRTKSELNALVSRLEDAAEKRRRYLDLAQYLATGSISHRRERTRQERLALRDAAVAELMEVSERPAPPELPGPEAEQWLDWACSLEDDTNDAELQQLKTGFPRLDDFVRQLEIEWWRSGLEASSHAAEKSSSKAVAASAKPEAIEPYASNGNGLHKESVVAPIEQSAVQETAVQASAVQEAAFAPMEQETIQLRTLDAPVAAPEPAPEQEKALQEAAVESPEPVQGSNF